MPFSADLDEIEAVEQEGALKISKGPAYCQRDKICGSDVLPDFYRARSSSREPGMPGSRPSERRSRRRLRCSRAGRRWSGVIGSRR
jgi:hypothetical protein